mgnify:CR=1 FL=1
MRGRRCKLLGQIVMCILLLCNPASAKEGGGVAGFFRGLATKLDGVTSEPAEDFCAINPVDGSVAPSASAALSPDKLLADVMQKTKEYRVTTKDLPGGDYRERCFACVLMPGEDGERQLSCVCPINNTFARLNLAVKQCGADEKVSFCGGMLICGPCKINNQLGGELAKPAPSPAGTALQKLLPAAAPKQ